MKLNIVKIWIFATSNEDCSFKIALFPSHPSFPSRTAICQTIICQSSRSCVRVRTLLRVPAYLKSLKPALVPLGSFEGVCVCLTSSIGMTWAYPPPAAPPRHKREETQSDASQRDGDAQKEECRAV